jgi:hypothetical protein
MKGDDMVDIQGPGRPTSLAYWMKLDEVIADRRPLRTPVGSEWDVVHFFSDFHVGFDGFSLWSCSNEKEQKQ